jgi:transcriptional regulator with XRE-family HTH domain
MGLPCFDLHVAIPTVAHVVKELRRLLSLTQDDVAERGGLDRSEVAHLETGRNKATSARMRASLALGLGLPRDVLEAALDGKVTPEAAVEAARLPAMAPKTLGRVSGTSRAVREDPYPSRAAWLILARAKGLEEDVLDALPTVVCDGGDPGLDFWPKEYRRMLEARRQIEQLAAEDEPDASSAEVLAKRKRKPTR